MFHPSTLETQGAEENRLSEEKGKGSRKNDRRIMRGQTEVFDWVQLEFQVLRIFCGLQCHPYGGLRESRGRRQAQPMELGKYPEMSK